MNIYQSIYLFINIAGYKIVYTITVITVIR